MKAPLLLLSLLLTVGAVRAQTGDPEALISRLLTPEALSGSRVTVEMDNELDGLLNRPESFGGKTVDGYRVYIFRDNSQHGRERARQTRERFRSEFPDIAGDTLIYQTPDWMVAVGHCLSREEAVIILGRVRGAFDIAWVRQEKIPLRQFLQPTFLPVISPDEDEAADEAVTQ